jgi:hypothetical protein
MLFVIDLRLVPMQGFLRKREVAEFVSGAMAGAMTKAVLAPLETIRYLLYFPPYICLFTVLNLALAHFRLYQMISELVICRI